MTLDRGTYYIPTASFHLLFDSFTINHYDEATVVISVSQITVSPTHAGSADGYLLIRKIMSRVRELLKSKTTKEKPTDKVEVKV